MKLEEMVRSLDAYHNNSKGFYRGISRYYYPKWLGWKLIEEGKSTLEIDKAVVDFYLAFYYYQMKLDLLDNLCLAKLLLNFAIINGKKKTLQKIQLIAGDVEGMRMATTSMKYRLLLEVLEFHHYTGNANTDYIWETYKEVTDGLWY